MLKSLRKEIQDGGHLKIFFELFVLNRIAS